MPILPSLNTLDNYLSGVQHSGFRSRVKVFLQSKEFNLAKKKFMQDVSSEPDPRVLYELLGKVRLLAPQWSSEYGGQGKTLVEMAIVIEELVNLNIPETLYILSILIVGNLIALLGTKEQKTHWLQELALGDSFACVLFSELNAGSDLAALQTQGLAVDDDYFEITGKKLYSLKTKFCDYALCAVRTNNNGFKNDGITVFLVSLKEKGVLIQEIPSMADEVFNEVIFDRVKIHKKNIIGKLNEGWHVISETLMLERNGLDCILKATSALRIVTHSLEIKADFNEVSIQKKLDILHSKRDAARILCYSLLKQYDSESYMDEAKSSIAKWYASTLIVEILNFGIEHIDYSRRNVDGDCLLKQFSALYRDVPGVTLAAGSSEMMLEIIAREKFNKSIDDAQENGTSGDALLINQFKKLFNKELINFMSLFDNSKLKTFQSNILSLITPNAISGMNLGLKISTLMCEESGKSIAGLGVIQRLNALGLLCLTKDMLNSEQLTILEHIGEGSLAVFYFQDNDLVKNRNYGFLTEDYTRNNSLKVIVIVKERGEYILYLVGSNKFTVKKDEMFGFDIYEYSIDTMSISKECYWLRLNLTDVDFQKLHVNQKLYYAAFFLGLANKACDLGVQRTSIRMQFGKKIIDYQASKFTLAENFSEITAAQDYLNYAIYCVENNEHDNVKISSNIFELAKSVSIKALEASLHLHGAYGLTREAEIQSLYRLFVLQNYSATTMLVLNEEL